MIARKRDETKACTLCPADEKCRPDLHGECDGCGRPHAKYSAYTWAGLHLCWDCVGDMQAWNWGGATGRSIQQEKQLLGDWCARRKEERGAQVA